VSAIPHKGPSRQRRKNILSHTCFNPFLRSKDNHMQLRLGQHECPCTRLLTLPEAKAYVMCELALWCFIRKARWEGDEQAGIVTLSDNERGYSEIVMMGKGHNGAAHTITELDIEKAYLEQHKASQKHIEEYGASQRETWAALTVTDALG
jgi:hypothetical protein